MAASEGFLFHDIVELVRALAWPSVTVWIVLKFEPGIASLLGELPMLARRMKSAHGLGVEIELDKLDNELSVAEQQAQELTLTSIPEPKTPGGSKDG